MRPSFILIVLLLAQSGVNLRADMLPTSFAEACSQAADKSTLVLLRIVNPAAAGLSGIAADTLLIKSARTAASRDYVEFNTSAINDVSLVGKYRVTEFPTIIALRPDGTELDRLVGRVSEKDVTDMLKAAAEGQPQLAQLRQRAESEPTVQAYGQLGDGCIKRGFYGEALTAFRWCLEQGPTADSAGYRRLLKTVVSRIRDIETKDSSAKDALMDYQQKAENQVRLDSADTFISAFTLNEALGDSVRNAALFEKLAPSSELRCELYAYVFENLVQARRYRVAVLTVDLETFIGRLYPPHLVSDNPHGEDVRARHTHRIAAEAKARAVNYTIAAVEASLGIGHMEKAKRLAGRLIDWTGAPADVRRRLAEAADRSGAASALGFKKWLADYVVENAAAN